MSVFFIPNLLRYEGSTDAYVEAESIEAVRKRIFDDLVSHIERRRAAHQDNDWVLILGRKYASPSMLLHDTTNMYHDGFVEQIDPDDIKIAIHPLTEYVSIRLITL